MEMNDAGLSNKNEITINSKVKKVYFDSIRAIFLYHNVENYSFTESGKFNHNIDKLPKVETTLKEKILTSVNQESWSDYCDIYYFSINKIAEIEYGIFLIKTEFNGLTYDFVIIQFNDEGSILFFNYLASWSEAVECIFYTNAQVENKKIKKITVKKCYDFELEERKTLDSLEVHIDITPKGFKETRKVRLM
jgi:hypothetical protein